MANWQLPFALLASMTTDKWLTVQTGPCSDRRKVVTMRQDETVRVALTEQSPISGDHVDSSDSQWREDHLSRRFAQHAVTPCGNEPLSE